MWPDPIKQNSSMIHGIRFYRAKVKEPIMGKYAAMTNPKEGEPGTKTNPLRRFGKEYVYNRSGDLVQFHRNARVVLPQVLSEAQKQMFRDVIKRPVVYGEDCPKSSPERLQRFRSLERRDIRLLVKKLWRLTPLRKDKILR